MYIKKQKGKIGENIVSKYLIQNNYEIIERNFRCRQGEIDIIAFDIKIKELVFIEVKTRSSTKYGRPCEAVGKYKKNHIISVAEYNNFKNNISNIPIRFDVIEVLLNNSYYNINHIKGAFFKINN